MISAPRFAICCALGLGLTTAVHPAAAQSIGDFYKNKTIKVIVSAGPGGGYATFANLLMKHMGKYVPGNPNFIRQHRQGAGGLVAANWLYHKAPKDGTVIALIHRGAVSTLPIFQSKNVRFNPSEFNWIGSMNASIGFCVAWHTQPVKGFKDVFTQPLIVGGIAAGSDTDSFPRVFNNLFGTKFKLITGYSSGQAINLAMERGEVQGRCGWSWSAITATRGDWLRDKKITLLAQVSLRKHPKLQDVPLVTEFATKKSQRDILELVLSPQAMGRPFLAPPKIPADRVKALQTAFDKAVADKALLADAKKRKVEINAMSGPEIDALIKKIYSMPKEVVAAAQEAMKRTDRLEVTVKKTPIVKVKTALTEIKRGGRRLSFKVKDKTHGVRVSGSRTKVSINGKPHQGLDKR